MRGQRLMIAAGMTIRRSAVAPYRAPDGSILVEMTISERLPPLMTWRQALRLGLDLLQVTTLVAIGQIRGGGWR